MKLARITSLMIFLVSLSACLASKQKPAPSPAGDPIAKVSAKELRAKGLAYARRGDLTRAQQYLSAAHQKGFDARVVIPEIVKICLADSRLRAALAFAEPYLTRNPDDAGMNYVVGTIHLALGNVQQASSHLSGALRPERIMIDAAYSLALIANDNHRPQEAREHLQHYLRIRPQGRYSVRAQHMLAELRAREELTSEFLQLRRSSGEAGRGRWAGPVTEEQRSAKRTDKMDQRQKTEVSFEGALSRVALGSAQ